MRVNRGALLVAGLIALVLLPSLAGAKKVAVVGSMTVTEDTGVGPPGAALTGQVTGLSLIANSGLEKTIPQQIPPYTVPIFTDKDKGTGEGLDTLVTLVNTLNAPISVFITLRDQTGALLKDPPDSLEIPAYGTIAFFVSDLIP